MKTTYMKDNRPGEHCIDVKLALKIKTTSNIDRVK